MRIRFTTHALERAVKRFFPGATLDVAQSEMLACMPRAAKLKDAGQFEERWLLGELGAILVCAVEGGERVVKTVLKASNIPAEVFPDEGDTMPAPSARGKLVIKIEVDYLINNAEVTHAEVQTKMEGVALNGFKGSMNSKKVTILGVKTTSEATSAPLARIRKGQ